MYAIIKTGGKQYRVKEGDVIDVELLEGELGSTVQFEDVLFFNDGSESKVGGPFVSGQVVSGELLAIVGGEKITSVKYQPGNHYKKFGHRQKYSRVKITGFGHSEKKKGGKHGT